MGACPGGGGALASLRDDRRERDVVPGKVQVFWDDTPDGAIRVMASIDDGGWRAFVPLTEAFILAPDGSFVDE